MVSLAFANFAAAIWPIPATYEHGQEVVWIDRTTKWEYNCPNGLVSHSSIAPSLRSYVLTLRSRIVSLTPGSVEP